MMALTTLILLVYADFIVPASPPTRASPLECVYVGIPSPPRRDLGY